MEWGLWSFIEDVAIFARNPCIVYYFARFFPCVLNSLCGLDLVDAGNHISYSKLEYQQRRFPTSTDCLLCHGERLQFYLRSRRSYEFKCLQFRRVILTPSHTERLGPQHRECLKWKSKTGIKLIHKMESLIIFVFTFFLRR